MKTGLRKEENFHLKTSFFTHPKTTKSKKRTKPLKKKKKNPLISRTHKLRTHKDSIQGAKKHKNLEALKPLVSLAELFKQHKAVLSPHDFNILIKCLDQRLFVTETPHKDPNQLLGLRFLVGWNKFLLGSGGNTGYLCWRIFHWMPWKRRGGIVN